MQEAHNIRIRTPGFALSNAGFMCLAFLYIGVLWGLLLVMIPLIHFFPALENEWIIAVPSILVMVVILLHMLCVFYTVVLEPDGVTMKWFGITVRKIPVERLKTFCAVGNKREDVLCLSCYSVAEMAQMQEKRLLRSFLNKHSVPFRKRKADWQNDFAGEYLNYLRRSPFSIFCNRDVIMFKMHPAIQYSTRKMYPQLPYRNYTGVTSPYVSQITTISEDKAVCLSPYLYDYKMHMEPDGIHIGTKKKEISFIPAQSIKTVVRVDVFKGYEKYSLHHTPLLFITSMSEAELAKHVPGIGHEGFRLEGFTDQALLAMSAATYLTLRWNKKRKDSCVVYHNEKNRNAIQMLYPHVHVNETAVSWLISSEDNCDFKER